MSILAKKDCKVMVFGMTGKYGAAQVRYMLSMGTQVVAGVSLGKGGQVAEGVPIVDTAKEAVEKYGANTAVVYMPPKFAKDSLLEAIESGVRLLFSPTEGIPVHDMMVVKRKAKEHNCWMVGPNSLGLLSPGECLIGSISSAFTMPGSIGVISRSGTLSLEVSNYLTKAGIGQSTVISMGGDSVLGRNPVEYLKEFEKDEATKGVVFLGELGGMKEKEICDYISQMKKPLFVFIGGKQAKPGKRMGHMGTITGGAAQDSRSKTDMLKAAGAITVEVPWELPEVIKASGILL